MAVPSAVHRVGAAIAIGYALGMFPTADLVAHRAGDGSVDLRRSGSGNPGGVNALNMLGARAGAAVLAGDIAKGAAACVIGGSGKSSSEAMSKSNGISR